MAPSQLELTIMGADDLKNVNTFGGKMDLLAVVYVDPAMKVSTRVLRKVGRNPIWNDTVTLTLGNVTQRYPNSYLTVEILAESNLGNKVVGTAWLNLHEVYRLCPTAQEEPAVVALQLQRPSSGRAKGVVTLAMRLKGDSFQATPSAPRYNDNTSSVDKSQEVVEGIPVMGIPVAGPYSAVRNYYENHGHGHGTTATGYPSLSADSTHSSSSSSSGTSGIIPYAYPPTYDGYPRGYTYPAPPPVYYPQVPYSYVQPPQPQRSSGGGLLLGLLGGAIGGLILGDILM